MTNRPVLFCISLVISLSSLCQINTTSLDLNDDVTTWFDNSVGVVNLPIVSGSFYPARRYSRISHQFFQSDTWVEIKISYSDQQYDQFFGLYDIESDVLLLRHPILILYSQPLEIRQEKVDWFDMNGHHFKYYKQGEAPGNKFGFHDELYMSENLQLVVKREKKPFPSNGERSIEFRNYDMYYLKRNNDFEQISSRRSVIKELWEYRHELRKFIRNNGLKPKKGYDEDLVLLLEYCDELMMNQ